MARIVQHQTEPEAAVGKNGSCWCSRCWTSPARQHGQVAEGIRPPEAAVVVSRDTADEGFQSCAESDVASVVEAGCAGKLGNVVEDDTGGGSRRLASLTSHESRDSERAWTPDSGVVLRGDITCSGLEHACERDLPRIVHDRACAVEVGETERAEVRTNRRPLRLAPLTGQQRQRSRGSWAPLTLIVQVVDTALPDLQKAVERDLSSVIENRQEEA
jgi:hypothetical protein